jgi:hypothetical protein
VEAAWIVGACFGVAGFLLSFAVAILVLVRLPRTYFAPGQRASFLDGRPPWQRTAALVGKNVAGAVLVVLGLVLSIPGVPGQGLLTILVGLVLLDVPGKRRLERRILLVPTVRRGVDALRRRFGREPFLLDGIDGIDGLAGEPGR